MPGPLARLAAGARRLLARPQVGIAVVVLIALAAMGLGGGPERDGGEVALSRASAPEPSEAPSGASTPPTDLFAGVTPSPDAPTRTPAPERSEAATPAPLADPATPPPTAPPAPTEAASERPTLAASSERLAPFMGLSTWIDVYDVEWTPQEQVDVAAAAGVDTLFVQSARHLSEHDIDDAERLAAVIDAAKAERLQVVTWYIADFIDPERDLRRAKAAIEFTTPAGNRADAFGLDIELDDEPDIEVRNARLMDLSSALRQWAGPDYPLAAIVLPPLQLDLNGTWWPGFPYAELTSYYDVFVPMSYSSYRGTDAAKTYQWNHDNVLETRRRAGDPDLPVHLAGGIADNLPEVDAFVQAAVDGQVLGAGLYDLHTTTIEAWGDLAPLSLTGPRGTLLPRGDG